MIKRSLGAIVALIAVQLALLAGLLALCLGWFQWQGAV